LKLLKKERFKKIYLKSLFLIFLLFLSSRSSALVSPIDVTDISYWSYPDYTRVVITLSDKADFIKNRLSNPDRLYFDIKNSIIKKEVQKNTSISNGMLKTVRAGQFNESTVRVVLDLEKINDYKILFLEEPVRIVIDINGQSKPSSKKRIVLDPGHGGHDPGAVGPNKLYEKDVVLDIALKLKKILSDRPDFEIFLTRDRDIFIPLVERTAIANSKKADLFVSIHANASTQRNAKGIETYFLNWTDNEESIKVAARENAISLKKMKKMNSERDVLEVMLGDLKREFKRDESNKLANYIQQIMIDNLNKDYKHIIDHGVKWAPFYVLFGAQMPSVLVEVSFISNPIEEKLLSKEKYRGDLAKSIASGINKYMTLMPEVRTIADTRKSIAP